MYIVKITEQFSNGGTASYRVASRSTAAALAAACKTTEAEVRAGIPDPDYKPWHAVARDDRNPITNALERQVLAEVVESV